RALREALGTPLAIEPIPTYLRLPVPQMEEAEFLQRFYAESGCDFLIDVAHEWLTARFAGRSPRAFLEELPLEAVTEIHVAGTLPDPDLGEPWIGAAVPDAEILDLAEFVAGRAPRLRAVTFDAFSTSLRAETLLEGMARIRERFGASA
ncbi:MAG: multinuclear nonheme iron-dependent oxidase, partial [Planctomycetota bacterium]